MRSEQELRQLVTELDKLTEFISAHGNEKEFNTKDFNFACNVSDVISWVLEEITTERFTSDNYIDVVKLKAVVSKIELRTGQKLEHSE